VRTVAPKAYLLPRKWWTVTERLHWNGVVLTPTTADTRFTGRTYYITSAPLRAKSYEDRPFHESVKARTSTGIFNAHAGDCRIDMDQPASQYLTEVL
jgi:hypothetical protein